MRGVVRSSWRKSKKSATRVDAIATATTYELRSVFIHWNCTSTCRSHRGTCVLMLHTVLNLTD